MRVIAHRGFGATAPENTIAAIRSAADRADAVEFDVRRCGSGELVVIHDETIDRVTDGAGTVASSSLQQLKRHVVLESGERIPTLEEMLAALPPNIEVNLEMKELDMAADVLAAIEGIENRVVTTSFLVPELRTMRDLDSDQPTGLLANRHLENPVTTAIELGCEVIGANWWRCLTTRLVPRAKAVDLEVHSWSIERRPVATLLEQRGVDYVSADRPIRP
ncbi:glycerophosphodiester phosphodiesterase [Halopiger aswanensis]|uniref:Glycerophosphoryl diester phosphodiesterase n=1 Tax=Halopiger aswanensis TaxID=148449 RepID=A0A419WPU4_9EURY|nr:glycerophosphodiester phosphodiesterase [Halopiger aswanensis]RKD97444.1 glycerophosphoryl diester phosphodiesterase [Halopiger aswanensis]